MITYFKVFHLSKSMQHLRKYVLQFKSICVKITTLKILPDSYNLTTTKSYNINALFDTFYRYRKYDEYYRRVLPGYPQLLAGPWMGPKCGGNYDPK